MDCGCTTTSMSVVGHAEQLVRLDHLQALVHEGGGVDGDLGAHRPRGMGQRLLDASPRPTRLASRPRNGPPLRGEHDARQLASGASLARRHWCERAVLGVDRHQLGTGRRTQRLHHRAAGDEALLVGQRQPLAGVQGGERDRQPGEAHHPLITTSAVSTMSAMSATTSQNGRASATSAWRTGSATATILGRNSRACATNVSTDDPTPRATTS